MHCSNLQRAAVTETQLKLKENRRILGVNWTSQKLTNENTLYIKFSDLRLSVGKLQIIFTPIAMHKGMCAFINSNRTQPAFIKSHLTREKSPHIFVIWTSVEIFTQHKCHVSKFLCNKEWHFPISNPQIATYNAMFPNFYATYVEWHFPIWNPHRMTCFQRFNLIMSGSFTLTVGDSFQQSIMWQSHSEKICVRFQPIPKF